MYRPVIFRKQLPIAFKLGASAPELGLQDQSSRSGRASSARDGRRVLAGNHQRFIDAGRNAVGECAPDRERPGLGCGSNGGRGVKTVDCNGCSTKDCGRSM